MFVDVLERTYHEVEQDRYTLERSIDISSNEMRELYEDLKRSSESQLAAEHAELLAAKDAAEKSEQLLQSQKMDALGQLAGGVAHDFNNILAAIMTNADLASEALGEHDPVIEDLREIAKAAQRAATLTRQLLVFSRQDRREVKTLLLNDVVAGVQKMLARIVREDLEMTTTLATTVGAIEADAGQIEQLLVNLVVNAADAMPCGGRIEITTGATALADAEAAALGVAPGRYETLAVRDTGCGMDEATRVRIFEPFFTTKPIGKGTGLGLSIVFGIVRQSGGAITVESELDRGSTFRVYLPEVSRLPENMSTTRLRRVPLGAGTTVLIVEDDANLRSAVARQLRTWGYRIFEAPNGAMALDLLDQTTTPIDLLLTDLVMPGMDGRVLARTLQHKRPEVKVLFMSGYSEHRALTPAGVEPEQFIAKPFSGEALSAAIYRALTARRDRTG